MDQQVRPNDTFRLVQLLLGSSYHWVTHSFPAFTIHYVGELEISGDLDTCVSSNGTIDVARVKEWLDRQLSCFAFILCTKEEYFGAVDHIRSYPIYYAVSSETLFIGNDARLIQSQAALSRHDEDGVSEFLSTGYVLGNRTLYQGLLQLKAGEFIHVDISQSKLQVSRHFQYFPIESPPGLREVGLLECLEVELERVFANIVEKAADREIWIPLSGGLDSRLVLCKLLERNYTNLKVFTYGVAGNHEMQMAEKVANALNVDWTPIESRINGLKKMYDQPDRRQYAQYADGLHMTPIYLDYQAIHDLVKSEHGKKDALIINGYSGDFLFGGHIPEELVLFPSKCLLLDEIFRKHCSHIRSSRLLEYAAVLRKKVCDELGFERMAGGVEDICALYEYWDWQERQPKAVINGQRLYEYFNLDWSVPLWDKGLVKFWAAVPLQFKLNQYLHIKYLKQYNYKGVFEELRSVNQIWPRSWRWIVPAGRVVDLFGGADHKERFYEKMFYFSYFRNQLGLFGYKDYLKWYQITRRPRVVPLAAIHHLEELDIPVMDYL